MWLKQVRSNLAESQFFKDSTPPFKTVVIFFGFLQRISAKGGVTEDGTYDVSFFV